MSNPLPLGPLPAPALPTPGPLQYEDNQPLQNIARGLGNAVWAAPGDVLGKLITALGLPGQAVRTAGGLGVQAFGGQLGQGSPDDAFREALRRAMPGAGPIGKVVSLLPEALQNVAIDTATDPLSYVGFGLPSRASQFLRARGMLTPGIEGALGHAQAFDKAFPNAMNTLMMAVPKKVAQVGLSHVPAPGLNVYDRVPDAATGAMTESKRPASNLWDYLTSKTPTALFHQNMSELADVVNLLKLRGHDLIGDVADNAAAGAGGLNYPGHKLAMKVLNALEIGLNQAIKRQSNPLAKMVGLEIAREAEARTVLAWEKAARTVTDGQAAGMDPVSLKMAYQQALQGAFEEAYRIQQGALDTFSRVLPEVERVQLDPAILSTVNGQTSSLRAALDASLNRASQLTAKRHRLRDTAIFGPDTQGLTTLPERVGAILQAQQQFGQGVVSHIGSANGLAARQLQALAPDVLGRLPAPSALRDQLSQRVDQLGHLQAGLPSWLADVPEASQGTVLRFFPSLQQKLRSVQADRRAVTGLLEELAQKYRPGVPFVDPIDPADIGGSLNRFVQALGVPGAPADVSNLVQLRQLTQSTLSPESINRLDKIIQGWPGGDLLHANPYDLVLDRVAREHGKALGLSDKPQWRALLGGATNMWKEQALLSGAYPLTNTISGLLFGALEGVNPLPIVRDLAANLRRAWVGEPVVGSQARRTFAALGRDIPVGATSGSGQLGELNLVREYLGGRRSVSAQLGSRVLGPAGALGGAISGGLSAPSDASPDERSRRMLIGAAAGGGLGAGMPVASRYLLQHLGGSIENVMRTTALEQRVREHLQDQLPVLKQIVVEALRTPVEGVQATAQGLGAAPTLANVRRQIPDYAPILQAIEASGGVIGKEPLIALLSENGVDPAIARAAAARWDNVVEDAVRSGTGFANKIHFDYADLTNLEQLIKNVAPFATWSMRALPFFVQHLAEHPGIAVGLQALQDESDRERKAGGLTDRFAGSVHMPVADQLWTALLGRPVQSYYNPLNGLSPLSGVARAAEPGINETPFEAVARSMSGVGLSLHPALEIAARIGGLEGDAAPRDLLRVNGLVKALTAPLTASGTGVDLNAAGTTVERSILEGLGQSVSNPQVAATLRRIDELALRETGKTTNQTGDIQTAPYIQAKDQRRGPIWDRARAEVAQEANTRSAVGFISGQLSPQALLGEQEQQIRGAQVANPPIVARDAAAQVRALAQQNPDAAVSPEIVAQARQAAEGLVAESPWLKGQMPADIARALDNPTAANIGYVQQMLAQEQENRNPVARGYTGTGGSPDEARLLNALAAYHDPAALMAGDPQREKLSPEMRQFLVDWMARYQRAPVALQQQLARSPEGKVAAQYLKERQGLVRALDPMLDAYLSYEQQQRWQGTPRNFLASVWAGRRSGSGR